MEERAKWRQNDEIVAAIRNVYDAQSDITASFVEHGNLAMERDRMAVSWEPEKMPLRHRILLDSGFIELKYQPMEHKDHEKTVL